MAGLVGRELQRVLGLDQGAAGDEAPSDLEQRQPQQAGRPFDRQGSVVVAHVHDGARVGEALVELGSGVGRDLCPQLGEHRLVIAVRGRGGGPNAAE